MSEGLVAFLYCLMREVPVGTLERAIKEHLKAEWTQNSVLYENEELASYARTLAVRVVSRAANSERPKG